MTGGALAANHYLINSTKQISPKVLKKLKGASGKAGPAGAPGSPGTPGKEGPQGKEGPSGKAASIAGVSWHDLTLENGWIEYGGYGVESYTKDDQGFVHLSGAIDGVSKTSSQFATLPPGFRPTRAEFIWLRAGSTNGSSDPQLVDIEIDEQGEMFAESASGANDEFLSLEGVTFYAG